MTEQKRTEIGLIAGLSILVIISIAAMIAMIRDCIHKISNPRAFYEPNDTKKVRDEVLSLIKEPERAIDS